MPAYYVNKHAQENGDHEVHRAGCGFLPVEKNRIFLGEFETCETAVRQASTQFRRADGCYHCSRPCHRS